MSLKIVKNINYRIEACLFFGFYTLQINTAETVPLIRSRPMFIMRNFWINVLLDYSLIHYGGKLLIQYQGVH